MAKGKYEYWLTKDGLLLIQGWARDGLSEEQIAKNMGISRSTLKVWKATYPAISATLKRTKEIVDREVENALYKRAMGFRYTEKTTETRYDQNGDPYTYERIVEKEALPDPTSMIFWLKNRKPAQWRDKPAEVIDDGDETGVIMLPPVMEDTDE